MVTARRVYLYSVLAVSLVLLAWGVSDLLRLALETTSEAIAGNARQPAGSQVGFEDLSRGLAFVIVGAPLWAVHWWHLGRTVRDARDPADERAAPSRAVYFTLVLTATVAVVGLAGAMLLTALFRSVLVAPEPDDPGARAAVGVTAGAVWLFHAAQRRRDLRLAPARLADDWLTRLYVYGVLSVAVTAALFAASDIIGIVARELVGRRPLYEPTSWWRSNVAGSAAFLVVAVSGWLLHWAISLGLANAPEPMGAAHRESRTRVAYLLGAMTLGVAVTLVMAGTSLQHLVALAAGAWRSSDGSTLAQDVGGPLLAAVPFALAAWWHARRASGEALDFGGPGRRVSVARTGWLLIAAVGLTGLAVGLAWLVDGLLEVLAMGQRLGVVPASSIREDLAPATAFAIVGLVTWAPCWRRLQQERSVDPTEAVTSTARRTYLVLVSGASLIVVMVAGAWLIYQATRMLAGVGWDDVDPAIAAVLVAAAVLGYHAFALDRDLRAARDLVPEAPVGGEGVPVWREGAAPTAEGPAPTTVSEILQIEAPLGTDLEALNASIRQRLPAGTSLRVVSPARGGV
jgi:hypothetical protein